MARMCTELGCRRSKGKLKHIDSAVLLTSKLTRSSHSLRRALEKMHAGPDGDRKVYWTSLREEPGELLGYLNNELFHSSY